MIMKKYFRSIITTMIILGGMSLATITMAQPPEPPAPGSGGGSNTPMGGAAPIDGGLAILLAAGIGYGAKKVYYAKFASRKDD
jgi:hypothetical protein